MKILQGHLAIAHLWAVISIVCISSWFNEYCASWSEMRKGNITRSRDAFRVQVTWHWSVSIIHFCKRQEEVRRSEAEVFPSWLVFHCLKCKFYRFVLSYSIFLHFSFIIDYLRKHQTLNFITVKPAFSLFCEKVTVYFAIEIDCVYVIFTLRKVKSRQKKCCFMHLNHMTAKWAASRWIKLVSINISSILIDTICTRKL